MGAVKGILASVSGVFATIGNFLGPVFRVIGSVISAVMDILSRFSTVVFVLGFFGLLFAFLWFILRYLDKKRLSVPTIVFMIFFFIFLSGNILLITQDMKEKSAADTPAAQTVETEAAQSGGETAV